MRIGAGPGEVSVTWLVAWVDPYVFQAEPEVKGDEWVNTGCCPTLPEWKWNLTSSYRVRSLTFIATWQHVGGFKDYVERYFDIPAKDYLDPTATYEFDEGTLAGLTLRAGVTNALDELPPIFPTYQQANTEPSVFDVLGRRYFLGARYAWSPSAR